MKFRSPEQLSRDEPAVVRFERTFNRDTVRGWLAEAVGKLADANRRDNLPSTRMDAAYDAILLSALALFALRRFRVAGGSGHHRLALEGMAHVLAMSESEFDLVDAVREWRNRKYQGAMRATEDEVEDAVDCARRTLSRVEQWLQREAPDVFKR